MRNRVMMGWGASVLLGVLLLAGCERSDSETNSYEATMTPETSATGVIPNTGSYAFRCRLQGFRTLSIRFRVQPGDSSAQRTIVFSMDGYAFYGIPVVEGRFYYVNGLWWGTPSHSGNAYPTDGFALSGHFVSADRAEGTISYAGTHDADTDDAFFDGAPFMAQR